ncbi:zinc ribbon domain-containing protein [Candidatus Aciduliprofundum boonei]|uniref:DUF4178 domain-containing protein n=1 Tax=Aciduliprofundum boonei (strain DSM 19572 / T469) TaxID=439481 RepID=D3T9G8_ACIB4|nr:zinc ribbon domain-containing protein [Candidatus Aciduliprofundum boonei]ADD08747.1 hypothetical protein Aboo_0938 [Aciduliprofundum boonei T469]HII54591.1 hypothetical protein [Candidatus Aciduliprofundum boonei]
MRLAWQCPTCYAELGDKSYAKMLTCPYCGSLLIVNAKDKKFYRVPKENGWYYFRKANSPGYIRFGNYEEHYKYDKNDKKWYLLKNGKVFELSGKLKSFGKSIVEEGEVSYVWGEFPFVAPPKSTLKTAIEEDKIIKISSRAILLFLESNKEASDIFPEIL